MIFYIYGIKNLTNNKYYIGITKDIGKRFNEHINYGLLGYENKSKTNEKKGLYKDIKELGITNFLFKVLHQFETERYDIAYDNEAYWIKKFNSINNGYNTLENSKHYNKDNSTHRYVYKLVLNNKIITVGTRQADSELNCIKKIKETLELKIDNNHSSRTIQYIINNGGLDKCIVKIVEKFNKDFNVEDYITNYMKIHYNELLFKEYYDKRVDK